MDAARAEAVMFTTVFPSSIAERSFSGLARSERTLRPDSVLLSLLLCSRSRLKHAVSDPLKNADRTRRAARMAYFR